MATLTTSSECSQCSKTKAQCTCRGCQGSFCTKHFNEHRQQLSVRFDQEIGEAHDELVQQIDKLTRQNKIHDDIFSEIDRWETRMIKKIQQVAEKVRRQIIELVSQGTETLNDELKALTKDIRRCRQEDDFVEEDIENLRQKIYELQSSFEKTTVSNDIEVIERKDPIKWNRMIYARKRQQMLLPSIPLNVKWALKGCTIAGGHGRGDALNQLNAPFSVYIDDKQSIYIADCENHRIVEWKPNSTVGEVVAGGNGSGNRANQLCCPTDVIVDKEANSLIICDRGNRRIMRWSCQRGTCGETIISNIDCSRLSMDNRRSLYVSDWKKNEVRRFDDGGTEGTIVARGSGPSDRLSQPTCIFVDQDHSVFVSDYDNHRVLKWIKDSHEGIIIAGGNREGNDLTQLSHPQGLFVDQFGRIYVSDQRNHRVMRWCDSAKQGEVIVDANNTGDSLCQLNRPIGLSFDQYGNLYVVDGGNDRVIRFNMQPN
ncbi:unnamed protein product [Rotaria socialis]|uniref:Uncharacterized protein n=1 Tax=Rotaria socialis TaxID=392032 RepID=A0A817PPS0_9BILA|nr:unnamed protein product [Rotaria socialis]CAF4328717.1 unnamed protein product [Rotaria socialis]CAF4391982.1 unnamed protein product [Rotaria socialis]